MYNLWFKFRKKRGTVDSVHISLFFRGHLNESYETDWVENEINYGKVVLHNIASLTEYQFGHLLYAECESGSCKVYFPPSEAILTCTQDFYNSLLFPKYLNFVSKDHRLTGYQISVRKIDFETGDPHND
jgi:hypothetical protein